MPMPAITRQISSHSPVVMKAMISVATLYQSSDMVKIVRRP